MQRFYAGIGLRENTPASTLIEMRELGRSLGDAGWGLRTGGLDDADTEFERGHRKAKGERALQVFTPSLRYGCGPIVALDDKTMMYEAMRIAAELHPAWNKYDTNMNKLHAQQAAILLGESLRDPVAAIVSWTPSAAVSQTGGTAMRIANAYGIPVFSMAVLDREEIESRMSKLMNARNVRAASRDAAWCPGAERKARQAAELADVNANVTPAPHGLAGKNPEPPRPARATRRRREHRHPTAPRRAEQTGPGNGSAAAADQRQRERRS